MPSSYTSSARFTLQATGENNNTWGVILNQGVFQLVDDSVNGRLAISLSGPHTLTVNLGATDEARMGFIDVTGGSGGVITAPSVSKSYFVHNGSTGGVQLSAGASPSPVFNSGDAGPLFTDGTTFYPVLIGGLTVKAYADAGDAAQKAYTDASIASASAINLPSVSGHAGQFLGTNGTVALWEPAPIAWRNRLINGDMRIDQRHVGGPQALTQGAVFYTVDRWNAVVGSGGTATANAEQTTLNWAPVTLTRTALQVSVTTAQATIPAGIAAGIGQTIEGLNIADLAWGTPNAQPVTISFVISVTVAGDYFVRLVNGGAAQSYVHKVTLAAATTTKVSFTVPGPTSGTWATDNTAGVTLSICFGSGATYQTSTFDAWQAGNFVSGPSQVNMLATVGNGLWLTDVQLEPGAVATSFERRAYAEELRLCQRYYENNMPFGVIPADGNAIVNHIGQAYTASNVNLAIPFLVQKRITPAITYYRGNFASGASGLWGYLSGGWAISTSTTINGADTNMFITGVGVTGQTINSALSISGGWAANADF